MPQAIGAPAPKHFYTNDLKVHPEVDLRQAIELLHALYSHWVAKNWLPRDFIALVDHAARYQLSLFLVGDREATLPYKSAAPTYAVQPKRPSDAAPRRLYDETGSLAIDADTDAAIAVLRPLLVQWAGLGWNVRDFPEAMQVASSTIVYRHQLAQQFGGMGGGLTGAQFLSQPFSG